MIAAWLLRRAHIRVHLLFELHANMKSNYFTIASIYLNTLHNAVSCDQIGRHWLISIIYLIMFVIKVKIVPSVINCYKILIG